MIPGLPPEFKSHPLLWGLACATLTPELRSILVYDCQPATLRTAAIQLSRMLQTVDKREVIPIQLGASETEDDLWGTLSLRNSSRGTSLAWQPGRLAGIDQAVRLVVIPDLSRLSLPAARACVALMGAEVAYLERHGQDLAWAPRYCWLAGYTRSDPDQIQVSPHLFDRFALRLPGPAAGSTDRVAALLSQFNVPSPTGQDSDSFLSHVVLQRLREAVGYRPEVGEEVVTRILEYFSESTHSGIRREIAVARLVRAHAQLVQADRVTKMHVDTVAELIGLSLEQRKRRYLRRISSPPGAEAKQALHGTSRASASTSESASPPASTDTLIYSSDTQESLSAIPLSGPYVEDEVTSIQVSPMLRLPSPENHARAMDSGAIIGTERTTRLHDLAIVSTVLEAAKFQSVRHRRLLRSAWGQVLTTIPVSNHQHNETESERRRRFMLSGTDLRAYRRAPVSKQMFVLVLDYTCLSDCEWTQALIPHLQWAYTERAPICLIQIGAATPHEGGLLRAQQILAPDILAPTIRRAFRADPGRATPLAHGLDLAARTLQRALQHDRYTIRRARLVVVSDGRGNVPLKASQTGTIEWPVTREGVEDALRVARAVRAIRPVEIFLLHPQPQQYAEFPLALAEALGVIPVSIPLKGLSHG